MSVEVLGGGLRAGLRSLAIRALLGLTVCVGVLTAAIAQEPALSTAYLEGQVPKAPEAITTWGPDMFGDKVNLFNGSFDFEQADIQLPGNNGLPVALIRTHAPGRMWLVRGAMADWDLHTPRIQGTFAAEEGWVPYGGSASQRCSGFNMPPSVTRNPYTPSDFLPHEYWQGTQLVVPGHGSQEILVRSGAFTAAPADGHAYGLVTAKLWQLRCLDNAPNAAGQGFVAVAPDVTQYRFDWMASRPQLSVRKGDALVGRLDMLLMATEVTDRFGNWVRYTYDSANRLNLLRIESSDGRLITLTYSNGRVATVSDQTRTWQYYYAANGDLQTVVLPDSTTWQFNLRPMVATWESVVEYADCDTVGTPMGFDGPPTGTIKHPSGAVGQFDSGFAFMHRTGVPRVCTYTPGTTWTNGAVYAHTTFNQALFKKTITGVGLSPLVWQYRTRFENWNGIGAWGPCEGLCADRKIVEVLEPDGSINRHTFGIKWQVNEGQLLKVEEGWSEAGALRTTTYTYRGSAGQAFPEQFGYSVYFSSDYLASRNRPQASAVITQQGVEFVRSVAEGSSGYDGLARPLQAMRYSTLGYSVTTATAYHDHYAKWVLGQMASVTEDGITRSQTIFDTTTAMPIERWEFGRLVESLSYYADGSLFQRKDALGRPTTHADYWRGIPRLITWRDGAVQSAQVNNYRRITSYTNAAGTTTQYGYDTMGRLASITYPLEGWGSYHPTIITFQQAGAMEFGLPAGHWQQVVTTGNLRTTRYFDAMWHEGLTHTRDLSDPAATSRFVVHRYDADGRKTFESQPQRNLYGIGDNLPGKTWWYDGLGRKIAESESNDPSAPLNTTIAYGVGFLRHSTNPRGYTTTTAFQAFDTPTEDAPTVISAPEGVSITIMRDIFGKAHNITRAGGGKSATRRYVYDLHQRLCKTVEPESGATIQDYDAAGNVAWRASGQAFTGTAACDQGQVSAGSRISFSYDPRNRLTSTAFGDGSPGITRTYTPDGLLQQIVTHHPGNPITWNYRYNNRRLLTREQYAWWPGAIGPDDGWLFHHGIEPHGNVSSLSDFFGTLNYAPNALGQPRQVSGYASGVAYHANGAVAGYTLANGVVHTTTQNARGLPVRMQHGTIISDVYSYDGNGNVTAIIDEYDGNQSRTMPWYDGLDRLRQANGPWGSASYAYDALDNLVSSTVGSRSLVHEIDPVTNRLTGISGSQTMAFGYDANGNLSSRGAQTFGFDIGNRMTNAPGKANYYLYDGHGRRNPVWFADGGWMHQAYTQDGKLRMGWRNTEGATRHVYLGDKLIAETTEAWVTTYAHADALGSPAARSNSSGGLVSRTRYEPYGATVTGSTNPTKIGFTGHVNDADTGLVYMQQRYYDPIAGRFLSVDPVTTDAKTGDFFGRYHYAENNPFKYTDPDGRNPLVAFGLGFLIDVAGQVFIQEKPLSQVNLIDAGLAGVGALATGNFAGRFATQALKGAISPSQAALRTAGVGGTAGAATSVASDVADGKSPGLAKAGVNAIGGFVGAGAAAKIGNLGTSRLNNAAGSKDGIRSHVGSVTRAELRAGGAATVPVSAGQAVGQTGADASAAGATKYAEKELAK